MVPGVIDPLRRIRLGLLALLGILVVGTVGYELLGFPFLDALYQTVTTVTTVGFRELRPLNATGKIFTIVLILAGVGTVFYTLGVVLESLIEGHLRSHMEVRRMERDIAALRQHVIVCGWGRVGRAIARYVTQAGESVVVVDRDPDRLASLPYPTVLGDVTDDDVLRAAGIEHARVLVAALETDADNLYVALSGRALRPDLVIIARARTESSEPKLLRAGADHVVNPQRLGGDRMAAFALQPHVVDYLDVVLHDGSLEIRIEEVIVVAGSQLAGETVSGSRIHDITGALILALRRPDGTFLTNPPATAIIEAGQVLIAVGSDDQVTALRRLATVRAA
jgi:voltage-gated potassium channel